VVPSLVDGDTPKTKAAVAALTAVTGAPATHVLVVITKADDVTRRSLRNAPGVHLLESGQLNTRDVLVSDFVVFTQEALDTFVARSGDGTGPTAQDGNGAGSAGTGAAAAATSEATAEQQPAKPKATRAKAEQEDSE
jgi:ribosomal protein L4